MSEHSHTRPAGRGYCGNTLQCMPSMVLAARMGADRCGEGEGASGAPDLQGDQRTGEKWVRGRRSKANAQDKYEWHPFTGRDPGEALFKEGTPSNWNWHKR